MRQQLITTIVLAIVLSVATSIKLAYFPVTTGSMTFYFQSTFWICGVLIFIISLNLLWNWIVTEKGVKEHRPYAFWPNRRKTFRIIYPAFIRPMLIVASVDGIAKRHLEFSIIDLSQEGGCFIDDGCLGEMKTFSGRIRFNNGDSIGIGGHYIRKTGDHVSVRFDNAITWSTLLEEQRRVLVHMKPIPRHLS